MRKLLVIVLLSAACFAQSFSTSGQFSATGQLLAPAPSTPPTILPAIGFGMHVHNPTVIQPSFPFDAYRIWGTSCQWDTIETAAATFNWSCIDQWIAFANTNNVDLIFTFGQLPLFLSTINPDAGNSPFPVPNNGITIACVGGGCTATVTTKQRLNAALGDTLVIAGDDGSCPENLTATGGATSVNNQTDYPWTYSFPIAGGTTNSTGCGGAAITLTDNTLSATRCNGTGNPPSGQAGGCYSPADIAVDGTGNDCEFNRNSGACTGHSGFLVAFLNHLASSDPNHKFKYFEMWNEPQGAGFFNGSIAQMARMQKDAYALIQGSSRSDIILTSPAPSGGLTSPATYLSQFCADPSQPGQYVQQWHVHTYNFPSGAAAPKPEDAMTIATNVKNVLASCPFASGKSLWASEGGWGQGQWALNGSIGPNTGTTAIADKAGWAFNSYAFHQCAGFGRFYWFALDQQCNTGLACTSPNSNQPAAYAYGLAHDIFTGSSISQACSQDTAKNWTLGLSRAGGYSAQIVWNENLTVPGSFTIPTGTWTRYRDVTGAIHSITGLQTSVPTNYDPIILENQAPPLNITTVNLPPATAGFLFSATLTSNCPNVPCTYAERSLPSVLTANHLTLNTSTGAITGTPLAAFSGSVIITIKDALGQTNNSILGLTVSASIPLSVTNAPCPASGFVGNNYNCTLTATGGVTPYTWTLFSGSNPDGTTLTNVANAGMVSGTLTTAATYTPVYEVTDFVGQTALAPNSGSYSIVISTAPASQENIYCSAGDTPGFGSSDGPATLPQTCIYTARSGSPQNPSGTVWTPATAAALTTDLASAHCGDTIALTPGISYVGTFTIPAITCSGTQYWLLIKSANWETAGPAEGQRVSPCWAGTSSLPGRPVFSCISTAFRMAQVITGSGTAAPIIIAAGANHVRIEGVEITRVVGGTSTVGTLITRNCSASQPCNHIIFDQVYGHGTANDETTRFMSFDNISFIAAVNGFFSDFHCYSVIGTCSDSQVFTGGINTGTATACFDHAWKTYNNYLESAAETSERGGGFASTTPCDLEDRNNWMFKPLTWDPVDASYIAPSGGHPWQVKNHWEAKNATRALIEGNVIQNVWGGFSQFGAFILLTPKSQANNSLPVVSVAATTTVATLTISGSNIGELSAGTQISISGLANTQFNGAWTVVSVNTAAKQFTFSGSFTAIGTTTDAGTISVPGECPACFVTNITIRYNHFISGNQVYQFGNVASAPCSVNCFASGGNSYSTHDNLAENLGFPSGNNGVVSTWQGSSDPVDPPSDYLHDRSSVHDTMVYAATTAAGVWPSSFFTIDGPLGAVLTNLTIKNSVVAAGGFGLTSLYSGTNRCGTGQGMANVTNWLNACWTGWTMDYNCIVGGTHSGWNWAGTHNQFPATYSAVNFVNYNNGFGGDYHLMASSPCHNSADDGTDDGANIDLVNQYTAGVGTFAADSSQVGALVNSNGSGCTANGSPDAGCNAAFTGLSTDAGNNNAQTQLLAPAPANMSTVATRSMLYSGATSKVRAYYQPFFRCGSHIDIGMDESDSTAIAKQAAAMVAMGIDIVNIDHYGTSLTCEKAISDGWATYLAANPTVPLKLEIMLDQGAIKPFCTATLTTWSSGTSYTVGQGVTFGTHAYVALNSSTNKQPDTNPSNWQVMETCIINAMEAQLDDIDTSYGSKSFYSKDSSGRPFLFYFITPATWANTDFSGTIYPALLTYAHTHYTGRVYQVLDRFGSFGVNFDGEYAWIQPPLYVNASPTSQKCWDSIAGGACNWATGVGSGTSYLNTFYTACRANPTKHCIGMLSKGFDWTHASWLTAPKIVQQGCGNVPQLMAAKVAANGYSSASQLEGIGWVTWNDYEEETAMEMGIDNCARPTVSVSAPNQLGWLENPTDATYFSESGTIDHWEIWYTTTGGTTLTKALGGIAPSVSTEVISSVIPAGTWDVYLYMLGKSGIINRLAGPAAYTH